MKLSREDLARLRAHIAEIDPLLVAAADEVDPTLLAWARSLSPLERLSAASRASDTLHRFQVEPAPEAS
jgi:HAMP domain-containing protein